MAMMVRYRYHDRNKKRQKKGKWIKGKYNFEKWLYEPCKDGDTLICSECEHPSYDDSDYGYQLFPYCPFCGAEMENQDYWRGDRMKDKKEIDYQCRRKAPCFSYGDIRRLSLTFL